MALDESFLHRMTLRFVGAINKVREEKMRELGDFFQKWKRQYSQKSSSSKDIPLTDVFEKIEGAVSDKLAQITNSITVKAIGHLGQLREEMIQKGIALDQQVVDMPKEIEKQPLLQPDLKDAQKFETASKIKEEIVRRNRILKKLLEAVPQFKILAIIEKTNADNYSTLSKATGYSNTAIRNYVNELEEDGFLIIDRSRKPYAFKLKKTPW
jgi:biotin operon repressor